MEIVAVLARGESFPGTKKPPSKPEGHTQHAAFLGMQLVPPHLLQGQFGE